MTNREWLQTLSDDELAHWFYDTNAGKLTLDINNNVEEDTRKKWFPTARQMGLRSTRSKEPFIEWLKEERDEN